MKLCYQWIPQVQLHVCKMNNQGNNCDHFKYGYPGKENLFGDLDPEEEAEQN